MEGVFEIADRKNSRSGPLARLLRPQRLKNIGSMLIFLSLAAVFILVRKRQLLKRVLAYISRLLKALFSLGAPAMIAV